MYTCWSEDVSFLACKLERVLKFEAYMISYSTCWLPKSPSFFCRTTKMHLILHEWWIHPSRNIQYLERQIEREREREGWVWICWGGTLIKSIWSNERTAMMRRSLDQAQLRYGCCTYVNIIISPRQKYEWQDCNFREEGWSLDIRYRLLWPNHHCWGLQSNPDFLPIIVIVGETGLTRNRNPEK